MKTLFGLPEKVVFCKKCTISNQRPSSSSEFTQLSTSAKSALVMGDDGICDACRFAQYKRESIPWKKREEQLFELLDRYRKNTGDYDVLVPGSGGKDSAMAAYLLKYKYGMHPLTVTWAPHMYTDVGWKNFLNWIHIGGFDNISYTINGHVHRKLTNLAFVNLCHPFQPFILGQKLMPLRIARNFDIKLIFYGENEAEYGNAIAENDRPFRDTKYYSVETMDLSRIYLSGLSVMKLINDFQLTMKDLNPYLPLTLNEIDKQQIIVQYLGYYIKWTPQEAYYTAVEHCGFRANDQRTEGTYSKYNSLDDKLDGLHYWTTYIKFGLGRASYDTAQEIRNQHLTREEGAALVRKYDGEFPKRYFRDCLEYMNLQEMDFWNVIDRFRPPHLWEKKGDRWLLLHQVS